MEQDEVRLMLTDYLLKSMELPSSDRIAAYPAANPYYPSNLGATIYRALGVDPRTAIADRLNRPMQLNEGEIIAPLFTGATN